MTALIILYKRISPTTIRNQAEEYKHLQLYMKLVEPGVFAPDCNFPQGKTVQTHHYICVSSESL